MLRLVRQLGRLACCASIGMFATVTLAQNPYGRMGRYDRLDAGYDAYRAGEVQRQYLIGRQQSLNAEMVFWSRSFPGWRYYAEPWPFLPGDIYGYPLAEPPVRQFAGRVEEQIGPNRWISRPAYAEEFAADPFEYAEAVEQTEWPAGPREF